MSLIRIEKRAYRYDEPIPAMRATMNSLTAVSPSYFCQE